MSYNKFTKSLSEDFKELTPDKEVRVKKRVGELGRDIQVSGARMKQLSRAPFGKFRPKIQAEKQQVAKSARTKNKLIGHATDALIRANISKQANTIKRINDLKQSLKDLGESKTKTYAQFIAETRRIRVLRTAHYTSPSNKNEILKSGFKDSPSTGAYHPDDRKGIVYTTPSSRVGSDYGGSRVNLKLVNPKMTNTDSPRNFGKNIKKWMASASDDDLVTDRGRPTSSVDQARSAFKQGEKIVRVPNAHGGFTPRPRQAQGSYIMMDKDVANKSIDRNPSPTIKAKNKQKVTNTQIKKK